MIIRPGYFFSDVCRDLNIERVVDPLCETDRMDGGKMAGNTSKSIFRIVGLLLTPILRAITPTLEEELEKFLIRFYNKALVTENPLDDMFAGFLLRIFDIPIPGEDE